jgi:hypothetical protein
MFDWKKYKEKLLALRELIEKEKPFGADVEVDLVSPEGRCQLLVYIDWTG